MIDDEFTNIPSAVNFLGSEELETLHRNNVLTRLEELSKTHNKSITRLFDEIEGMITSLKIKPSYKPLKLIRIVFDHSNKVWLAQKVVDGKITFYKRSRDKGILENKVRRYCEINGFEYSNE